MKMMKGVFAVGLVAASMICVGLSAYASGECFTVLSCGKRGTAYYSKGNYSRAIPYFLRQLDFADGSHDDKQALVALNNLAISCLRNGDKYFARAWVKVALTTGTYPYENSDKATRINAETILPATKQEKAQHAVSGTYRRYAGYGRWSVLQIKQLSETTFKAKFDMVRYGNVPSAENYGPAALGDVDGLGEIDGTVLNFSYKSFTGKTCRIRMEKKDLDIVIAGHSYADGCEFGGYNLYMDGVYMLTDVSVPPI